MLSWGDSVRRIPSSKDLIPKPVSGKFQPEAGTSRATGILDKWAIQPFAVGEIPYFQIVFAKAQSVSEIQLLISLLESCGNAQVCAISPSEVFRDNESSLPYWQQRGWLDSCQFGDVLAGAWNFWAHIHAPVTIPLHSMTAACLLALYIEYGSSTAAPYFPPKRIPLEHSAGVGISIDLPVNCMRLAGGWQLHRLSLTHVRTNSVGWHLRSNRGDAFPSLRENVIMICGKTDAWPEA